MVAPTSSSTLTSKSLHTIRIVAMIRSPQPKKNHQLIALHLDMSLYSVGPMHACMTMSRVLAKGFKLGTTPPFVGWPKH